MSDTVTPAAPAAPAPNEVPIEQNPTNAPTPVGAQAPDKPVGEIEGSKARPESRREAIQRAFDKAAKMEAPERPTPKPREAKMGDNNPPEATPKEKPEPQPREPQPREQGKFAPRQAPEAPQAAAAAALPEGAAYRDPPPRLSEKAKAEWSAAPESVRGDVHRMQQEFEGAYKRYRGDHEAMETIRPYHDLATKHGTTLDKALGNYVGMENLLRQDPVRGLDVIVSNLNLTAPDGRKISLRDIAHHVATQSPEQLQMMHSSNAQMAQSHQLQATNERLMGLERQLQELHHDRRVTQTRGAVDQFADAHPRFDELGAAIKAELDKGLNLEDAYILAEAKNPGTHAAQTRTSTTAQTRPATDKSISGAPESPSNGTGKRKDKPVGRRDAIQNAIRRVNGSL